MKRKIKKIIIMTSMVSLLLLCSLAEGGITSYAKGPGEKSTEMCITTYYQSTVAGLGGWEQQPNKEWKFKLNTGGYVTNSWVESVSTAGNFYYLNNEGVMLINSTTPDGYSVDANGVWKKNTTTLDNTNNPEESSRSASNSGYEDNEYNRWFYDEAYLKDLREHPIDTTYSLH